MLPLSVWPSKLVCRSSGGCAGIWIRRTTVLEGAEREWKEVRVSGGSLRCFSRCRRMHIDTVWPFLMKDFISGRDSSMTGGFARVQPSLSSMSSWLTP